eukprot:CAMPEP_0114448236 /NCGR_PEP_ID=MMETSP0103-20121206/20215_1 /TAXON_ID=37642 ORGANISM="Paraphysomonas imperforata, Strain PA2" /NCGR_SAMPLE_ID=MMETSP0103 /ASSEMBLY_ACC=CAM_ASM_000201 /LENGTH=193 /DNA_ID=CAMNT_0001620233 /DNA_START=191 /DNA_END=769 /DNA_ORIENTATION=-
MSDENPVVLCSEELTKQLKSTLDKLISHHQARESKHIREVESFHASQEAIKEQAQVEAQKIIADAESLAKAIISEAEAEMEKMKNEVSQWNEEQQRVAHTQSFEPRIKIDVGGNCYTTSCTTLCRFPESMIGVMFSGRHPLTLDDEGYCFIDRDGAHFRHILNFPVDLSPAHLGELKREATYYGLVDHMFSFT